MLLGVCTPEEPMNSPLPPPFVAKSHEMFKLLFFPSAVMIMTEAATMTSSPGKKDGLVHSHSADGILQLQTTWQTNYDG